MTLRRATDGSRPPTRWATSSAELAAILAVLAGVAGFVGDGVADEATIANLKGRHMLLYSYASLFDAVPTMAR